MKSTLSKCAQHVCKCVCVSCVSVSNNIPFSANNIRETSTYLHHNKICTLISSTLSSSGTLGRRMHPGREVQSPNLEHENHTAPPSPPSCKFYGFPQDAVVFNLSVKARRHSRLNSVGRFGSGRLNGGHHTVREHKHMHVG